MPKNSLPHHSQWPEGPRPVPSPILRHVLLLTGAALTEGAEPRTPSTPGGSGLGTSPWCLSGAPSLADGRGQAGSLGKLDTCRSLGSLPHLSGHYWSGLIAHWQTRYSPGTQGAPGWHRTGGCHCAGLLGTASGPHKTGSSWASSSPRQDLEGEIQAQGLFSFPQTIFF